MYCSQCGKKNEDSAKFCFSCGAKIIINLENSGKEGNLKKEGGQKPKRYGTWFFVAIIFSFLASSLSARTPISSLALVSSMSSMILGVSAIALFVLWITDLKRRKTKSQ